MHLNLMCRNMHGSHCEYVEKINDVGNSILGEIIYSYIEAWENIEDKK